MCLRDMLSNYIRVSVHSLCRDGADPQYMQKPYNFTTNAIKAYLWAQACSLSAFVISNTQMVAQKPRGRQLNVKVCSSESTIFLSVLTLILAQN